MFSSKVYLIASARARTNLADAAVRGVKQGEITGMALAQARGSILLR